MAEPVLLVEKHEGVATLTLNRPRAMNALSRELRSAIVDAFTMLRGDDSIGVVILTGAGRAFCAGLDLKELGGETGAEARPDEAIGNGADTIDAMLAFDRPIIGAINGFAITGGFELALACDVLIASTEARFADTHARVGILPGWGLSQKLSRATGNYLPAEQAASWGLVNRVVAPDDLLPTCQTLARDMLSCVPEIMRTYKRVIDEGFAATLAEGLRGETTANRAHARSLTPAMIAERRQSVQARGRTQTG